MTQRGLAPTWRALRSGQRDRYRASAWQHAFNGVTPEATMAFQSTGTSFIVAGVPIARDSLLTEAGLDLVINRNATVGVSYVGQAARTASDHAAKGKFIWKF